MTGYELVTQQILALLENGTVPWRQPWAGGCPSNLFTKREYRGVNVLLLACRGYTSPYWATEKQIERHGGEVRWDQLENSTPIIFWRLAEYYTWNSTGFSFRHPFGLVRVYEVYNVEQTQGVERFVPPPSASFPPIEQAEQLIASMPSRPLIKGNPRGAFYSPRKDEVSVPPKEVFVPPEEYYSTLFHELVHATGHPSRLNRKSLREINTFGDHDYSQEELVAEVGAAMLCGLAGLAPKTIENSAAYIRFWLQVLANDQTFVIKASAQAQKAADFVRGKAKMGQPSASEPGDDQLSLFRRPVERVAA